MRPLRIVFAGTPEFALPCLDSLITSKHFLQAIYTQPDRPAGRGRKMHMSAVKDWALAHNISVYQPLNFKTTQAIEELAKLKPDVLVVIAYGLILPAAVLKIPRLGCINVHASLLPRGRGASPIQQAILAGDTKTGITIMQMDVGMDTGDMWIQAEYLISTTETAGSLHDQLARIAVQPLLTTLDNLASNSTRKPEVQDNKHATYAHKIHKKDALINWQHPAVAIDRLIRAFNPWPIAYTMLGEEVLRIHQAQIIDLVCDKAPGTVLSLDKKGMLVATGEKALLVQKIQFAGAKALSVAEWLNSGKKDLYLGLSLL